MISSPHYRRNFGAFLGDYVGFALGLTLASPTTVLPYLVARLGGSEVAVGLMAGLANAAWLVPQLIYANILTNKRYKKPYLVWGGIVGRPSYVFYAIALALGLHREPVLALLLLYAAQVVFFASDALVSVAWFDLVSKAIPDSRRGRLFGAGQLISGLLSIGAGGLIAVLLGEGGPAFPTNYVLILALSGLCFLLALVALGLVVEPDEPVEEERPVWREYLPRLLSTLRQDRAFLRLIIVRLLAGFDGLALSFYVLFATRELGLPAATIGLFVSAQIAGRIVAGVVLGAVAERSGSHRVVQVAAATAVTAPLVGLALLLSGASGGTTTAAIFSWVFVTIGLTASASMLGHYNYTLVLAPAGQRPTYIGLLNTISSVLVVLPILGGWLLRVTSYGVLFALTALAISFGFVLSLSLPSARQQAAPAQAEPAG